MKNALLLIIVVFVFFSSGCKKDDSSPTTPTNKAPNQPVVVNPADGAINQPTSLTLSWTCTDPENDALTYDVYAGTTNPPLTQISANQTLTNYSMTGLSSNTKYYWKIVAKDAKAASTSGTVWNFTTGGAGTASISGHVTDATNNNPLTGAVVTLKLNSSTIGTVTTASNGYFEFLSLNSGTYTLSATKTNYIEGSYQVDLTSGELKTFDMPLSIQSTTIQYRIVLSWGNNPRDLDAHLFKGSYHVYYDAQGYQASTPYTTLDVDDTSGYGPETITIYNLDNESCRFYVHNYSGKYDGDIDIKQSQAQVKVYSGSVLLKSYAVPSTGTGFYWYVFDISAAGAITDKNYITDVTPTGNNNKPEFDKKNKKQVSTRN